MTLPTPLPPSDQCGDTATHPPHPHGSGRCYGLDGLEDLPRGPLVQQLRAAHAIVRHLCHFLDDYTSTDTSPMVEAHAEHMRQVAAHTAEPHGLQVVRLDALERVKDMDATQPGAYGVGVRDCLHHLGLISPREVIQLADRARRG